MMSKLRVLLFSLLFPTFMYGQEICDNGIDDNGNGLIDLNDPDCACYGIAIDSITSLFPNPSFEDTVCCPDGISQMACAASWIQASNATTDYFHTCGFTHVSSEPPPAFPLPASGSGYIGFMNNDLVDIKYQEYAGACLDSSLQSGQDYQMRFFLARAGGQDTIIVSIFGTPNCHDLPWAGTPNDYWTGVKCPVGTGSWIELGRDTVILDSNLWQQVNIPFTAPMDIQAVALGGACDIIGSRTTNYYYADELTLAAAAAFKPGTITEIGKWCTGDLQLLADIHTPASVDTPGGVWQWYRSGIALQGETSDSLDLMTYGIDAVYTAVYTLNDECVSMDHVVDTTDPANQPRTLSILNQDTIVCEGTVIPVTAVGTPGYRFQWTPNTGLSDPHALTPDITTAGDTSILYTLTASYPGCPDTSQSFLVGIDSQYLVSFKADPKEVCVGRPIYFYPSNSDGNMASLSWQFPDHKRPEQHKQAIYQHAFEEPGTFPITLYSAFRACPDTSFTDSITVYPFPEVDLGSDSSICLHGQPVYLKNLRMAPLTPYHQVWNTGDSTEVLKVVHPGIYTLTITTDPIGCTTTESIRITKDCYIDIPNAFTPNGDGQNDYFFPRQLLSESVSRFHMQVFNRWGQIIFETNNPDGRGWDGRLNDKTQAVGVYLYRIEAEFTNGKQERYEGNVTLIR